MNIVVTATIATAYFRISRWLNVEVWSSPVGKASSAKSSDLDNRSSGGVITTDISTVDLLVVLVKFSWEEDTHTHKYDHYWMKTTVTRYGYIRYMITTTSTRILAVAFVNLRGKKTREHLSTNQTAAGGVYRLRLQQTLTFEFVFVVSTRLHIHKCHWYMHKRRRRRDGMIAKDPIEKPFSFGRIPLETCCDFDQQLQMPNNVT